MFRNIASYIEGHTSFFYFCCFGVCGVLVDLDHAIQIFYPIGFGRVWHPALIVVCWISLGCFCSFIGGLLVKLVLKKMRVHFKNMFIDNQS